MSSNQATDNWAPVLVPQEPPALVERVLETLLPLIPDLRAEHRRALVEVHNLRLQLNEKKTVIATKDANLAYYKAEIERLKCEMARREAEDAALEAVTAQLAKEAKAAGHAQNEVKRLKAELSEAKRSLDTVRQKLAAKTEDHAEALRLLHEGKDDVEAAEKVKADAEERVRKAREELAAVNAAEDKLRQANKELEEDLAHLMPELEDTRKQLRNARYELANQAYASKPATGGGDVDVDALTRHLETAPRQFEEDPDKAFRALNRARGLLGVEKKGGE